MRKPIIGVSPSFDPETQAMRINGSYFKAIEYAGGIPVMLSMHNKKADLDQLLELIDGILLPGGRDILPLYYGENILKCCGATVPAIDDAEILLTKTAFERDIPLLGICKGCQMVNTAMGGTLYQDIAAQAEPETALIHAQGDTIPGDYPAHSVHISKDSRLYDCFGCGTILVNSFHHQACKDIAPGFFAAAHAEDGVVEAVELISTDRFFLGVQWHPEAMFKRDDNAQALFKYFINECIKKE